MPKLRELGTTVLEDYYDLTPKRADDAYMGTVGRSFTEQLAFLFPNHPQNLVAAHAFYDQQREAYEDVQLYPGVIDTILYLNESDASYALCSSTDGALASDVIRKLLPEFQGVVTGRDYGPKATQLESHTFHQAPWSKWFIGDTPWDEQIARAASVNFVPVTHTFTGVAFDVAPVDSLPEAVDEAIQGSLRLRKNVPGPTSTIVG